MPQHLLEGGHLRVGVVAAIVYDDVQRLRRLPHARPERRVALVSDEDFSPWTSVAAAGLLDVDAVHHRSGAEVGVPEAERAATVDADLQDAGRAPDEPRDRKSTRLNSSHANISYAVFC